MLTIGMLKLSNVMVSWLLEIAIESELSSVSSFLNSLLLVVHMDDPLTSFFLGSHGDGFAKGAMWSVVTALMWSSWGLLSTFPVVSLSHCVSGARSVLLDVVLSWPWLYVWVMFVIRGWYTTNRDASADEVYVWRVLSWAWIIFGEACRHVWLLRNRITLSPQQLGGIGFNQRAQHSQH